MSDLPRYSTSLSTSGALPLTPLIDMVFLIVIFFMVNATFALNSTIPVELPGAGTGIAADSADTVVSVAADGGVFVNDQSVTMAELRQLLAATAGNAEAAGVPPRVVLRGDARADYGRLITVMDAARASGITDVALVTTLVQGGP